MGIEQDHYNKLFGLDPKNSDKEKAKLALKYALDTRKFEIGLYWRRATYFWTLIAAAFAGYFAILSAEHLPDSHYLAFIIGCIGLFFTWAWFLVNRGSKYWQENWENHVDMLEDSVTGPLYKTALSRGDGNSSFTARLFEFLITGPLPISVSKINQWVSAFTCVIWGVLIFYADCPCHRVGEIVLGAVTIIFGIMMLCRGKTHRGRHRLIMRPRSSEIIDRKVSRQP